MKRDRNYYRMMRNSELLEEAKYGVSVNWQELALVLGERLEKIERGYCPRCDTDEDT